MIDEEVVKKIFKTKKGFLKFAESLIASIAETAILNNKISVENFKNKPFAEIKDILYETIIECTNENGEVAFTFGYTEEIIREAESLKEKQNYRLSLILYATAIEHYLNEIIQKSLASKKINLKEIESIMRLDIEAKRTWLFPLLGLPRLSKSHSNYIKIIADKRNEFVHYKWKSSFIKEHSDKNEEYENLCEKAKSTLKYIKGYKTKNLISQNKIKKILDSKKVK